MVSRLSTGETPLALVIERLFAGKTPSVTPFYCFSAGGLCSGKGLPHRLLTQMGHDNFILIGTHTLDDDWRVQFAKQRHLSFHPEKLKPMIGDFYDRAAVMVEAAVRRGVSIVFEDHGDFPHEVQRHLALAKPQGYESFLIFNSLSPPKLEMTLEANQTLNREKLPWTYAYHKRVYDFFPHIAELFEQGAVTERQPSSMKNAIAFKTVMGWQGRGAQRVETIYDPVAWQAFHGWKDMMPDPYEVKQFARLDRVMALKRPPSWQDYLLTQKEPGLSGRYA